MTDKEKLKEIKKLADAMYYAAFNLTTDASILRKAMKEYHQFIIHEYCKEEPVAPKVLEDMLNAKTAAESLGISAEEHDKIIDLCLYGKEPEMVDIDDLPKEEPVSEDLGEYINELSKQFPEVSFAKLSRIAVRVAKWQKQHLWKPADGDDLPEIDREVIVFTQPYPLEGNEYVVSFAHRPNPDGWDGKSIATGKDEHYTPKTYGKGDWNIPDVKYWLDIIFPNK